MWRGSAIGDLCGSSLWLSELFRRLRGNGRQCLPANSDVCPEMNIAGGERLLTARGKAFVAAFGEVAAPKYDCSPATPWSSKAPPRLTRAYAAPMCGGKALK
jgi:hypothetical protein